MARRKSWWRRFLEGVQDSTANVESRSIGRLERKIQRLERKKAKRATKAQRRERAPERTAAPPPTKRTVLAPAEVPPPPPAPPPIIPPPKPRRLTLDDFVVVRDSGGRGDVEHVLNHIDGVFATPGEERYERAFNSRARDTMPAGLQVPEMTPGFHVFSPRNGTGLTSAMLYLQEIDERAGFPLTAPGGKPWVILQSKDGSMVVLVLGEGS